MGFGLDRLVTIRERLNVALTDERVLRSGLGRASQESSLKPIIQELIRKVDFAIALGDASPDSALIPLSNCIQQVLAFMDQMSVMPDADYISQSDGSLQQIRGQLDTIQTNWPVLVSIAIDKTGMLADLPKLVENAKAQIERQVDDVRASTVALVKAARIEANDIQAKARLTATGVSVEAAQQQFAQAEVDLDKKVWRWQAISASFFLIFVVTAGIFASLGAEVTIPSAIYKTAIRIAILTALAAATTFSLRILRAHMHMREFNLHRKRVTNSISAFVEAADQEQRGIILGKLVDAVISFGNSGLLESGADTIYAPQMTVDALSRIPTGK